MKWNTKKPYLYPPGYKATLRRFAFLPVQCNNDKTYWLEYVIYELEAKYLTEFAPYIGGSFETWQVISVMPEKE